MSFYDNPAGRLHALLEGLSRQEGKDALVTAWAHVLGVPEQDVPLHLGDVGQLVRKVQSVVEETESEPWKATVGRYRGEWLKPIFPPDHSFNAAVSNVMPDPAALDALGTLDTHLHAVSPEGDVPDDSKVQWLKDSLQELIDEVKATDDDLPEELKHEICDRLADILKALVHIDIGGPKAVTLAMEALVGSVALRTTPEARKSGVWKKIGTFLGVAWVAFVSGPRIQDSIGAWEQVPRELTAAAEKAVDVIDGDAVEEPTPDSAGDGSHPATASEDPPP